MCILMTMKCCYYERDGEHKHVCTTDKACPKLKGWTLVGSWGVENCKECFGTHPARLAPIFTEGEKAYIRHLIEVFLDMLSIEGGPFPAPMSEQ